MLGEFGCLRRHAGCRQYLEDLLTVINDKNSLHWAFYSFREDTWDGMDYELGRENVPETYWEAINKDLPPTIERSSTREFEPIRARLPMH